MNIDSKADFAGRPMLLVRDLVREIHRRHDGAFDADDWPYVFTAGRADDRDRVLAELAARGYVRLAGAAENEELPFRVRGGDGPVWVFTELGNQLANTSAARPVCRAPASDDTGAALADSIVKSPVRFV